MANLAALYSTKRVLGLATPQQAKRPRANERSDGPMDPRKWLAEFSDRALNMLAQMPTNLKDTAFEDLVKRCDSWKTTWETNDPELDPEEDVGCSDVEEGDLVRAAHKLPPPPRDGYPGAWHQHPGTSGFNSHAQAVYQARGNWKVNGVGQWLQPQQDAVAFFLHPASPVKRLLVDHATGSGKTLQIIALTELYYFDERPKILIFPKEHVCSNFYQQRLRWPGRWRDFFCLRDPEGARLASGGDNWKSRRHQQWDLSDRNTAIRFEMDSAGLTLSKVLQGLVKRVREALEMKKTFRCGQFLHKALQDWPEEEWWPAAPLRAYRFTSAGGRAASLGEDGRPLSAIFKIRYNAESKNVYDNKVVALDEGHHLTRPHRAYDTQLSNLRDDLYKATGTVLACFTGTIAGDKKDDARKLLDSIKGEENKNASDEGFLSSFCGDGGNKPREVPAGVTAGGLSPDVMQTIKETVILRDQNLMRYLINEAKDELERDPDPVKLRSYSNMYVPAGSFGNPSCKSALMGDLRRTNPLSRKFSMKLVAICDHIVAHPVKTLVMISRRTGYVALLTMLQEMGQRKNFGVATMENLQEFHDTRRNLRGERLRVLIADSDKCGEGVEFFGVRHHHMADVPDGLLAFKQNAGRSVRLFGHTSLPRSEQNVRFFLWTADLPRSSEIHMFFWRALCGRWSGPAKRVYASEPSPDEVETLVRRLAQQYGSCNSLQDLSLEADTDNGVEQSLSRKLLKRIEKAYEALDNADDVDEVCKDAADVTLVEELLEQAADLGPVVELLRAKAMDHGLY